MFAKCTLCKGGGSFPQLAFSRSEVRLQLDKDVTFSLNMYTLFTRPDYNLAKHKRNEKYLPTSH